MITLDCETVGLTGPIVLFQYAVNDGPIELYSPWYSKIKDTLELFEWVANYKDGICGFNLVFDVFHICQMHMTLLALVKRGYSPDTYLEEISTEYAIVEREARDGPCWKPVKALDLLLHARKGPFQTLMNREDVRIKKVPINLAYPLCDELNKRIALDPIYFSRKKTKSTQWQVYERDGDDGDDFRDIVLKFAASTALKALSKYALGMDDEEIIKFDSIGVDDSYLPKELLYAPYALALATIDDEPCRNYSIEYLLEHKKDINWNYSWPFFIDIHVSHWQTDTEARRYATGDIDKTRKLYEYFNKIQFDTTGETLEPGDDDSELACAVAACRHKGFAVDLEKIKKLKVEAQAKIGNTPTAPAAVKSWIMKALDPTELTCFGEDGSTKKIILEKLSKMMAMCPTCHGPDAIEHKCNNGRIHHPAAARAQAVLDAREAQKEIQIYDKILVADRLHADFNVIGALSSRMSGSGGINAQGINKAKKVRECFSLAHKPMVLCGGDFAAFEVVIAVAVWGDKKLEETVTSYRQCHKCVGHGCEECKGTGKVKTKIHALFGTYIYSGVSYEEILDSDGSNVFDYYTRSKSGLFSQIYGGTAYTLADRLGIPEDEAQAGFMRFVSDYPDVGKAMARVKKLFQSMIQKWPHGPIEWSEPADYIEEPVMGHRRYFTLENKICKALFDLAENPPKDWNKIKIKVMRRDREQFVEGAVRSALYAAAFTIQAANTRAAINHEIQASGAKITKYTQRKVWDIQPSGVHPFVVMPMNVHDELMVPTLLEYVKRLTQVVKDAVEHFRVKVPLISMDWYENIPNWAAKKG